MNVRNPCGLGVWARYEGIVDFGRGNRRYIYRRRRWAYLWPGYWRVIFRSRSHLVSFYTIKQHSKYCGFLDGARLTFYLVKAALFDISSIIGIPIEKSMPDGVDTMYNCVRDNPEEWMIHPYIGMPVRRDRYSNER